MGLLSIFKKKVSPSDEIKKIHIWLENNPVHPAFVPECDKDYYEQETLKLYGKYQMLMEERDSASTTEYRDFLVDMINRIEATKPFSPPPLLEDRAKISTDSRDCVDINVEWD